MNSAEAKKKTAVILVLPFGDPMPTTIKNTQSAYGKRAIIDLISDQKAIDATRTDAPFSDDVLVVTYSRDLARVQSEQFGARAVYRDVKIKKPVDPTTWKAPVLGIPADTIVGEKPEFVLSAQTGKPAFDECAASGESCSYRADGPNGEMQCRYCGKSQVSHATDWDMIRDGMITPDKLAPTPPQQLNGATYTEVKPLDHAAPTKEQTTALLELAKTPEGRLALARELIRRTRAGDSTLDALAHSGMTDADRQSITPEMREAAIRRFAGIGEEVIIDLDSPHEVSPEDWDLFLKSATDAGVAKPATAETPVSLLVHPKFTDDLEKRLAVGYGAGPATLEKLNLADNDSRLHAVISESATHITGQLMYREAQPKDPLKSRKQRRAEERKRDKQLAAARRNYFAKSKNRVMK